MEILNFEKISFNIITYSENARTDSLQAINLAKNKEIAAAETMLEKAQANLKLAEVEHVAVIQQEAQGVNYKFSILFVHAEDQIVLAQMMVMMAKEFIDLYKLLNNL